MFAKICFENLTCLPLKKIAFPQSFWCVCARGKQNPAGDAFEIEKGNGDVRDYNTGIRTAAAVRSSIIRYEHSLYVLQSRASRSRCSIRFMIDFAARKTFVFSSQSCFIRDGLKSIFHQFFVPFFNFLCYFWSTTEAVRPGGLSIVVTLEGC